MNVYYHEKFELCIISGSKVSRGVQTCTHPRHNMFSDTLAIGLIIAPSISLMLPLQQVLTF